MASLSARSPIGALLPIEHGSVRLAEAEPGGVTWIAPLRGRADAVSKALVKQIGAGLPEAGQSTGKTGARVVWAGPGQAFVVGPATFKPIAGAAMTDHSSAWARCTLEGADAVTVLARLVAIDLRDSAFAIGQTARTQLGHMACSLTRTGAKSYEIMVFRSMAASAVHELARAMEMVAARTALAG